MPEVVQLPHCTADLRRHEIMREDRVEALTSIETRLLTYLAERAGRVVTRSELLTEVWGYHPQSRSHTVAVTVRRLRVKIERDPSRPDALKTVRGHGWILELLGPPPDDEVPPAPARTNLQAEPDRFFGRKAELDRLCDVPSRLITLHGPAGIGKTRLARELGRSWAASGGFDQVWFCDLSGCRTLPEVARVVADALEVQLPDRDAVAHLSRVLALRGRIALVLDNFEQVADVAADVLAPWLRAAPSCVLLVTSRRRLRLRGEHTFEVPALTPEDARELFVDRAEGVLGAFSADAALLDEVITVLDRLPLAVELAAARMNVFDLATLRDRLADRLGVLTGGPVDAPERHSTLRTALDWSWDLLEEAERAALARCSVFVDGFTLEAAEAVIDAGPGSAELVASLLDASFIRRPQDEDELRLDLYGVIAQYAAEQLGDDPAPARRHALHYARFGDPPALRRLESAADPAVRSRARLELGNLAIAVDRALALGEPEVAARCALGSLAATRYTGPYLPSATLADRVGREDVSDRTRLDLATAGSRAWMLGRRRDDARRVASEALALARALAAPGAEAVLECVLAVCDAPTDQTAAGARLERALALALEAGDREAERLALANLARLALNLGDATAPVLYRRELALCSEIDNARGTAWALLGLGTWHRNTGRPRTAARLMYAAMSLAAALGETQALAAATLGLFDPLRVIDPPRARHAAMDAIALGRAAGNVMVVATSEANLGIACLDAGELDQARDLLQAAAERARSMALPSVEGLALAALGEVRARSGSHRAAGSDVRSAVALLRSNGLASDLGEAICRQGQVALHAGAHEEAAGCLDEARDLADRVGAGPRSELARAIDRLAAALSAT